MNYRLLEENGIDAKIHYPIPMHLQPAAEKFNYKKGDFPKAEFAASSSISLPVHEFISEEKVNKMAKLIINFFTK